ncbi:MAG: hypothetical protein NTX82_06170 [Candidatus Parcubacteria bacterium]|nr:hypothetical protein [Candidatus Parcubacteria bacterium]
MDRKVRKMPEFFANLSAVWELIVLGTLSFLFFAVITRFVDPFDFKANTGKVTLCLLTLIAGYTLYQSYHAYQQIKEIRYRYRILKKFPQLVGLKPTWEEILNQAITMTAKEFYEQSHPLLKDRVEKLDRIIADNEQGIVRLKKTKAIRAQKFRDNQKTWHKRLASLTDSLKQALQLDVDHIGQNAHLLAGLAQEIAVLRKKLYDCQAKNLLVDPTFQEFDAFLIKKVTPSNDREQQAKAFALMIQDSFWEEFYQSSSAHQIALTISQFQVKVAEADKTIAAWQAKITELAQKLDQILAKAQDNEIIAKQLGQDLNKLKVYRENLRYEKIRPRVIRQIEYELDSIIRKYDLRPA